MTDSKTVRSLACSAGLLAGLAVLEVLSLAPIRQWASPRIWLYQGASVLLVTLAVALTATLIGTVGRLARRLRHEPEDAVHYLLAGLAFGGLVLRELQRAGARLPLSALVPISLTVGALLLAPFAARAWRREPRGRDRLLPTLVFLAGTVYYWSLLRSTQWWKIELPVPPAVLLGLYLVAAIWIAGRRRGPRRRALLATLGVVPLLALLFVPTPNAQQVEKASATSGPRGTGGPPVLFVVLDTVRADVVDTSTPSVSATPHLARLATEASVYENVIANASWTVPGHASLFTGLALHEHRTDMNGRAGFHPRLPATLRTGAELFAQAGYRTEAIVANPVLSPDTGLLRGFHRHHNPGRGWLSATLPYRWAKLLLGRPNEIAQVLVDLGAPNRDATADEVVDLALDTIARSPDDLFLFLNFMDAHVPYGTEALWRPDRLPLHLAPFARPLLDLAGKTETLDRRIHEAGRREYGRATSFLDRELGRLLKELRASGWYDRALIVVTSDHGEAFNENPALEHYVSHGGAYEPVVRIPLLVKLPGQRAGRRIREYVQQEDLLPMVLAGTGLTRPREAGREAGGPIVTEWYPRTVAGTHLPRMRLAAYDDDLKLVFEEGRGETLYDLQLSPFEAALALGPDPERVRELRATLAALLATVADLGEEIERPEEELLEQLRELGYVQ